MHNDLLTIGKFTIHGYGLMIGIGFAAAYLVTEYRARKRGMDTDMVYILFFSSIIFGLLGAKLCYYLTILDELLKDFSLLLSEGFVVYGGIIGGVLAGYVACRIKNRISGNILTWWRLPLPLPRDLDGSAVCWRGAATGGRPHRRCPSPSRTRISPPTGWR